MHASNGLLVAPPLYISRCQFSICKLCRPAGADRATHERRGRQMTPNEMLRRVARGESEFDGVHLPCAALGGAALASELLTGANLRKADLHEANLQAVRLQDADLREANLRDANLALAILRRADLRDADLRRANLQH